MDDAELEPEEVARDARLLRALAVFSVTLLVVLSVALSVALRMPLNG